MSGAVQAVTLAIEAGIATLTLNRPAQLNAMSRALMAALDAHLQALAARHDIRAVIVTGTGRAFSAGGDLIEFEGLLQAGGEALIDTLRFNQDVLQRVEDLPVPVIGAANGLAVAGGLELLLCCDLLLAADGARIGDGHAQYGVVPAGGATVRLRERLAPAHAARLFYTAQLLDARRLMDWGLINDVVPAADLMGHARDLARSIRRCSPEALRHVKRLVADDAGRAARQARIRSELEHFARHLRGRDLARGLAAFRNRQPADFEEPHAG